MDHLKCVGDHIVLLGQCAERRKYRIVDILQEKDTVKRVDSLSVRCYQCALINLRLSLSLLSFTGQIIIFSCDITAYLIHDIKVCVDFLRCFSCGV